MKSQLLISLHQGVLNQVWKTSQATRHFPSISQLLKRRQNQHEDSCKARCLNTTSRRHREVLLPGNIVQSPKPDLIFPDNSPLHEILFEKCDLYKDDPSLSDVSTGRTYTFSQLKEKAIRVASALSRKGYKKGDIILAFSGNHIDFSVLMLAASCLGVVFSAANPAYTVDELARHISHCEAKGIFIQSHLANFVNGALANKNFQNQVKDKFAFGETSGYQPFQTLIEDDGKAFPDVSFNCKEDVYALPYSSGTTGFPKGVMLTQFNIVSNLMQVDQYNGIERDDNVLGLLPLYHAYAQLVTQFGSIYTGAHIHNLPNFEPESFLTCLQDRKISYANLVPPLIVFMIKHPMVDNYDLSNLKYVTCAAAPLALEQTKEFLNKFPHMKLIQGYGMTEASPGVCLDKEQNIGSVGPAMANTLVRIRCLETGENLGPNKEGELLITGPQLMKGYFKNPEATRETIDEDGWMYTGDIAYYDDKGLFYISDRLKELIKYKGLQVAPAELESILLVHSEVADACVLGIPDERAGEIPKAFVVKKPNSDVTEETIMKYVADQVSDFKRLRGGVEFIDAIPKNPSGKILRRQLRK